MGHCLLITGLPAFSDTGYSDTLPTVTVLAIPKPLQWSAVTVTVGYSDSFGNPRFITNKTPLLTVTKIGYSDTR